MSKLMLIDATHVEETRVALIDQNKKLIEFDFESANKKTIKGNIYLAKVMRVEPSLQAAFVDYGGNRHGFLAFSEIHPDYFRIPVSDREALSAKLYESAAMNQEDDEDEKAAPASETTDEESDENTIDFDNSVSTIAGESIEHIDDDDEEERIKRPPLHRMYKIQEVVHKNQILLIQVIKEERGQKGAALTTYLSLAGRYCVLMPNSPHAGGISRKIASGADRKRLKETLAALEIPREMGLIIRTAGKDRTKIEVKRDTDYLMRLWDEIRQETLKSMAPALVYQEDNIIKRALRDLYTKDVDSVIVQGDEGYKEAKEFIKKLLPSHSKKIMSSKNDQVPLFSEYGIERQMEEMHKPVVQLPSGGSIVIHPTEALVSIDINSGRATRERHIEETAVNTNIEAAIEIARQVRLRDLAGLIVIDFIDMDDRRHINQVERKIREAFKDDRARVQMSKISPFGLLELSRQRLRPSILETSSTPCPHCHSTGYIRSTESMALQILRAFEEEGIAGRSSIIKAQMPTAVAFYILNEKRDHLNNVENRHQMKITIECDETLTLPHYRILQLKRKGSGPAEVVSTTVHTGGTVISSNETSDPEERPRNQNNPQHRQNRDRRPQGQRRPSQNDNGQRNQKPATDSQNNDSVQDTAPQVVTAEGGDQPAPEARRRRNRRNRYRTNRSQRHGSGNASEGSDTPNNNSGDAGAPTAAPSPAPSPAPSAQTSPATVSAPKPTNSKPKAEKAEGKTVDGESKPAADKPKPKRQKSWLKRLLDPAKEQGPES